MRNLTHVALVLLLGLTCDCLAQSLRKNKEKPAGAIAGRITLNGKGIAGVRVSAVSDNDRYRNRDTEFKATTDVDGQFRVPNLSARAYRVWPNVPAFIVSETGGLLPQGKPVIVNEGETVEDINFALVRGAIITGKVTDADGRAVIGELVRIIPTDQKLEGVVDTLSGQDHQTDDRGVYRVYGLPPGSYKVAMGEDGYGIFNATRGRRIYKQTFHPDVTDETKAKLVEVAQGAEVSNIDIAVGRTIDGFAVSGRVANAETGQPLSGVRFGATIIIDGQRRGFSNAAGASDSNGDFRLDNVPVGTYSLSLIPGDGTEYIGETNTFEVVDRDVTGLELKAARGATLTGRIALEGSDDKAILAILSQAHLQLVIRSENGFPTFRELALSPDGSFHATGVTAGTVRVIFNRQSNDDEKFSILRIERDGIDQPRGLMVKSGEQITGLRVVVGYGTGGLRGTVRDENGSISSNAYIYVQLQRQSVSGPITVKSTGVDSRGRFLIERVPTGNYELAVWVYDQAADKTSLKARQPIVISDGIVSEISVPINLKPNSTPIP